MHLHLRMQPKHFNSRPHKEVDRNTLYFIMARKYFNSRPHKEVDPIYQKSEQ